MPGGSFTPMLSERSVIKSKWFPLVYLGDREVYRLHVTLELMHGS